MTGWEDDDEVITTFGSLRQGMQEAAMIERMRIIGLLEAAQAKALVSNMVYWGLDRAIRLIKEGSK